MTSAPLLELEARRKLALRTVRGLEERLDRAKRELALADSYLAGLEQQKQKGAVFQRIRGELEASCPVCGNEEPGAHDELVAIHQSFSDLRQDIEYGAERHPQMAQVVARLRGDLSKARQEARETQTAYSALLKQQKDEGQRLRALQLAGRVVGRVSMFLQQLGEGSGEAERESELTQLRDQLSALEITYGRDRLRSAHAAMTYRIAKAVNDLFQRLPAREPCIGSELVFDTERIRLAVLVGRSRRPIALESVGSDQNYLAIHMALSLGIQRVLREAARPVPGVLVIDQVSRPYFPRLTTVVEMSSKPDEDTRALRTHFDQMFAEVDAAAGGLQVIVLEHAYFDDDPRYVKAVKHRWGVGPGEERLIPNGWPVA